VRARHGTDNPVTFLELCLRLNYISSIAWANVGLLFLLIYPYDSRLLSPTVLLASVPYFLLMGSDLRYNGYKFSDVLRVYGLNLILLPVNLAGVLKSLQQAMTGKKIPFARTPKVKRRTSAPLLFVVAPYAIVAFSAFTVWRNISAENWGNALFAAVNTVLALATILTTIGIWNSIVDVWLGLTNWLWIEKKRDRDFVPAQATPPNPSLNWRSVLYHGGISDHPQLTAPVPKSGEVVRWSNEKDFPMSPTSRELQSRIEELS
jgi:hypothetical protein